MKIDHAFYKGRALIKFARHCRCRQFWQL